MSYFLYERLHSSGMHPPAYIRPMPLVEAIVLNVMWPDDPGNIRKKCIEVDLVTPDFSWFRNIPWLPPGHASQACFDWYVPRPSEKNLATGRHLERHNGERLSSFAPGTRLSDLDGDRVLIGWEQHDRNAPVILRIMQSHKWQGQAMPKREYEAPTETEHHARVTGLARVIANGGSRIGLDEVGNIFFDARFIPPKAGNYHPDEPDVRGGPAGTVYVQARAGQRIVLAVDGRPDLDALGYGEHADIREEYAELEESQGGWPEERTLIVLQAGKLEVTLPPAGELVVSRGGNVDGGVVEVGALLAELARLREDIARMDAFIRLPQTIGNKFEGDPPSTNPAAGDLAAPGVAVPGVS